MSHTIIAVTGLNGSGKSTLAAYLTEEKGFIHVSFRKFLIKRLEACGKEATRENMRTLANAFRQKHGARYAIDELLAEAEMLEYLKSSIQGLPISGFGNSPRLDD